MTTAVQVQYRRGTASQVSGFTGAQGELVVDTTNNRVVVQDGATAGGFAAAKLNDSAVAFTGGTVDGVTIGGATPAPVTTSALHVDTGTKTATASAGAATLNKMSGVVTSESLTTAAGADYTLTLTNSDIAAADQVFASVQNGSNTQGDLTVGSVTPGAGQVVIVMRNMHASQALNGTIKISFLVVKN
jgi:hypothetical protein